MTPEEKERIAQMPEIGPFDAKLIFVRELGRTHWKDKEFDVSNFLTIPSPVKNMSRDQLLLHLAGLEESMRLLRAYSQGQNKGYSEEVEPEIVEKQKKEKVEKEAKKKEKVEKEAKKKEPATLDAMLAKMGMSLETFKAELVKRAQAKIDEKNKAEASAAKVTNTK